MKTFKKALVLPVQYITEQYSQEVNELIYIKQMSSGREEDTIQLSAEEAFELEELKIYRDQAFWNITSIYPAYATSDIYTDIFCSGAVSTVKMPFNELLTLIDNAE